jgi:hypothetical protein
MIENDLQICDHGLIAILFRHLPREKPREISGRISRATTEIRTQHLKNKSLQRYCKTSLSSKVARVSCYIQVMSRRFIRDPMAIIHTLKLNFSDFRTDGPRINSIYLLAIFITLAPRCSRQFWSAPKFGMSHYYANDCAVSTLNKRILS